MKDDCFEKLYQQKINRQPFLYRPAGKDSRLPMGGYETVPRIGRETIEDAEGNLPV